jgi:O-acetyl-ADP-ribose deacetylase (regulator of RNase III)
MSEITYATGDATRPTGEGPKIIVHICNDKGGWGKGFVVALSRRWEEPEAKYRLWSKQGGDTPFELGQVQFVEVEMGLWVANLIGQHGTGHSGAVPPVRYEAIKQGLMTVAAFANENGASVHMPRIGCGLAGGRWEEIEPIIEGSLIGNGVPVTVYDFAP